MARPKPDFPPADAIRALADAEGRLILRVTPGARVETVELGAGLVQIKVRAKPEGGKANEAVLELLAEALGLAPSRLQLLRGATGRDKQVRIS
jgi:uncharacterized protein YggU (UPF0235/DUF167 family)